MVACAIQKVGKTLTHSPKNLYLDLLETVLELNIGLAKLIFFINIKNQLITFSIKSNFNLTL